MKAYANRIMLFGVMFKCMRAHRRMSQGKLIIKAKLTRYAYATMESGGNFTMDTFLRAIDALDIPTSEFMKELEEFSQFLNNKLISVNKEPTDPYRGLDMRALELMYQGFRGLREC